MGSGERGTFRIESTSAGPFVTVLTLSGPMENGAEAALAARLADPELTTSRVVIDFTEATLADSSPLPLLEASAERFRAGGGELVLVGDRNPTVAPFAGDSTLPGLRWFASLDEALVDLFRDMTKLAEWPPPASA